MKCSTANRWLGHPGLSSDVWIIRWQLWVGNRDDTREWLAKGDIMLEAILVLSRRELYFGLQRMPRTAEAAGPIGV